MLQDIFLLVIGAVIGFVGQVAWRRYESWLSRRERPVVAVTQVARNGMVFAEIHNLGRDGIRELSVTAEWVKEGQPQRRKLVKFFRPNENPLTASPVLTEFLGPNERLLVADLPSQTDEGVVALTVHGLALRSHEALSHTSDVVVALVQPPASTVDK